MSNPAAFQATYSDCRPVKSRGVLQIILEVPIENNRHVLDVLGGMPTPANEVWVAVARLNSESPAAVNPRSQIAEPAPVAAPVMQEARPRALAIKGPAEAGGGVKSASGPANEAGPAPVAAHAPTPSPRAPRPFTSLPLPQQAGMLCADPVFRKFLEEEYGQTMPDEHAATEMLRILCTITSRRELTPDSDAGRTFIRKRDQFMAWKLVAA